MFKQTNRRRKKILNSWNLIIKELKCIYHLALMQIHCCQYIWRFNSTFAQCFASFCKIFNRCIHMNSKWRWENMDLTLMWHLISLLDWKLNERIYLIPSLLAVFCEWHHYLNGYWKTIYLNAQDVCLSQWGERWLINHSYQVLVSYDIENKSIFYLSLVHCWFVWVVHVTFLKF